MNLKHSILQYGYLNSLIRFFKLILRKIGIQHEVYLYCTKNLNVEKITETNPKLPGKIQQLSVEIIRKSHLIELTPAKKRLFNKRIAKKNFKGYGFFHNNTLVYYTWLSFKDFEMSRSTKGIELDQDEGLLVDSYCHPDFRQYGIHQFMNNYRLKILAENGKQKVVAVVLKENIPARRTQRKSGFLCEKIIIQKSIFNFYESTKLVKKRIEL